MQIENKINLNHTKNKIKLISRLFFFSITFYPEKVFLYLPNHTKFIVKKIIYSSVAVGISGLATILLDRLMQPDPKKNSIEFTSAAKKQPQS